MSALRAEVRGSKYEVGKRWFRAVGAIVGARHASPAVCDAHVLRLFSISILRARHASPLQSLTEARLTTKGNGFIA